MVWAPECKYISVKLKNHLELDHLYRIRSYCFCDTKEHPYQFSKVVEAHSIAYGDCGR